MHAHTAWVIFGSTALAGLIRGTWALYRARKAKEPTPMKLKRGVYVPWGVEERSHFWKMRFGELYIAIWLLIGIAILAKWMGWWSGL